MASVKGGVLTKSQETVKNNSVQGMKTLVLSMQDEIAIALPSVITGERFTRMMLTAMSSTPELQKCTPKSFLGAMMQAAQLGVEPNTPLGQAYLIPFKNKGILECQFQLGYKGLIDLVYRSGEVNIVQAHVVHENDECEYELGLEPKLKHVPAKSKRGAPVYYYAMFKTKNGGYGFSVMSIEDVREHAKKYSQSFSSSFSPWAKNFDEMAKKTVLKQCLKYAPLKTEFVRAIVSDETIKSNLSDNMGEVADETDFIEVEKVEENQPEEEPMPEIDPETGEVLPANLK